MQSPSFPLLHTQRAIFTALGVPSYSFRLKQLNYKFYEIGLVSSIVQDTCYKFLLHKDGIQSDKVISWLYRVATNQFYDLKRKEKRHPTTDVDEVQLIVLTNIPEIRVLKKEKSKDIRDTLETLSIFHQELLVLKYELELSYKEISALVNMNENTLKTHVRRAKEKFIERFKEEQLE